MLWHTNERGEKNTNGKQNNKLREIFCKFDVTKRTKVPAKEREKNERNRERKGERESQFEI